MRPPVTKILPVRDGVVHYNDRIQFPARPMVGVVEVATGGEDIPNAMPGLHGGNLDDHLHGIGTKIYFPVRKNTSLRPSLQIRGRLRRAARGTARVLFPVHGGSETMTIIGAIRRLQSVLPSLTSYRRPIPMRYPRSN